MYIAVSQDKYELPIAVADTAAGLSKMLGLDERTVACHLSLVKRGKIKKQKYFKVEVDDDG